MVHENLWWPPIQAVNTRTQTCHPNISWINWSLNSLHENFTLTNAPIRILLPKLAWAWWKLFQKFSSSPTSIKLWLYYSRRNSIGDYQFKIHYLTYKLLHNRKRRQQFPNILRWVLASKETKLTLKLILIPAECLVSEVSDSEWSKLGKRDDRLDAIFSIKQLLLLLQVFIRKVSDKSMSWLQ